MTIKKGSMVYLAYDKDGVLIDMDERAVELAKRIGITRTSLYSSIRLGSNKYARVRKAEVYDDETN